jgi:peptidoglycan/LPS O-acetylase OafA/YrhL
VVEKTCISYFDRSAAVIYRAEIDGLRAIAVLSVVFYHAKFLAFEQIWFQGGYIGVDVFLVISGYLITRIILAELFEQKTFSFRKFYDRRMRRILPILLVVMLVSFPFAWLYLIPSEFIEYSKSIIATLFFSSNFFFYFSTTEYGTQSALLKPFLHTWSLGVEEQFYILFPLLVLLAHKFFRKHLLGFLIVLFLFSLQFSESMGLRDADFNFYSPVSRFWELLVGSLLAYVELKHGIIYNRISSALLPALGIFMVIWSSVYFGSTTRHPGYQTLVPVMGTALIITYSSQRDWVGRILGSKLLVAVGAISYSAYLWHFPIFAFSRIRDSAPDNLDKAGWIAITLALSIVSYRLIEQPFRNKLLVPARLAVITLISGSLLLLALQFSVLATHGFEERVPKILRGQKESRGQWYQEVILDSKCTTSGRSFCTSEISPNAKWINLLGDSHMGVLVPDLKERLSDQYNVKNLVALLCWPTLDVNQFNEKGDKNKYCSPSYQRSRIDELRETKNSIVIISGRLPLYLHEESFDNTEGGIELFGKDGSRFFANLRPTASGTTVQQEVQRTLHEILEQGHQVILVYPIPEVGWIVSTRLWIERPKNLQKQLEYDDQNTISTSYRAYLDRTRSSFSVLDGIVHKNLHRVYPHTLFCDTQIKGRCVTHDDDALYYIDNNHLSLVGASMVNDLILEKIKEIKRR